MAQEGAIARPVDHIVGEKGIIGCAGYVHASQEGGQVVRCWIDGISLINHNIDLKITRAIRCHRHSTSMTLFKLSVAILERKSSRS